MATAKKHGEKESYWVFEVACLGRDCFTPGLYETRGATMSGSRNTGYSTNMCMTNAHHGCPLKTPRYEVKKELAEKRKIQGWTAKK